MATDATDERLLEAPHVPVTSKQAAAQEAKQQAATIYGELDPLPARSPTKIASDLQSVLSESIGRPTCETESQCGCWCIPKAARSGQYKRLGLITVASGCAHASGPQGQ